MEVSGKRKAGSQQPQPQEKGAKAKKQRDEGAGGAKLPPKWVSADKAHRQLLPREFASPTTLPRAQAAEAKPWPKGDLFFKRWLEDDADDLIHDVLVQRGWECRGDVTDPTVRCRKEGEKKMGHLAHLEDVVAGRRKAPRRCVWLLGASGPDIKIMADMPGGPDKHRINSFIGTMSACFKNAFATAFRDADFFPLAFSLPDEKDKMVKWLAAHRSEVEYWAVKPKNQYGGDGIKVYPTGKELSEIIARHGVKRYVAQRYVHRPLLVGGYKFHIRVHCLLTGLRPPRAYLHHDGHCMFATKPYTLAADTVGKDFDPFVHLTNYSINATRENKGFMAQKGIVGPGTMWSLKYLLDYFRVKRGLDVEKTWKEITRVSAAVMRHIAGYSNVKKGVVPGRHFELFGLDMMLDEDAKVWLLEANDSVGVEYCASHVSEDAPVVAGVWVDYEKLGQRISSIPGPVTFTDADGDKARLQMEEGRPVWHLPTPEDPDHVVRDLLYWNKKTGTLAGGGWETVPNAAGRKALEQAMTLKPAPGTVKYVAGSRATPADHPDAFSDEVLKQVIHDTYTLLGIDEKADNAAGRVDNWIMLNPPEMP